MADQESLRKPHYQTPKGKSLPTITNQEQQTSKYFSNFIYKALIVSIFLVIIPLFQSQSPKSINQTIFSRSWELLHLLFVGIAVSYGLFSRKTEETGEKSCSYNARSYVSGLLQVSSVFDEEVETLTGSDSDDGHKLQTWSNQYFRNEPENFVVGENRVNNNKSLCLPVRSLKSVEFSTGVCTDLSSNGSVRSGVDSGSKRISRNESKIRNGELNYVDLEEKFDGNGVLPSPIPWRSRTGRMELKGELDSNGGFQDSMDESEYNHHFKSNAEYSSPSTKKVSSYSSSESQAKTVEDMARKKSFQQSTPPPAPPPPPPMSRKPPLVKSNLSSTVSNGMYREKEFRRRSTSDSVDLGENGDEDIQIRRVNSAIEPKSVRTTRVGDSFGLARKSKEDVNETEATSMERSRKKTVRFDQTFIKTDKPSWAMQYSGKIEEKNDFLDEVIVKTEDESESESDDFIGVGLNSGNGGGDVSKAANEGGGPDVDKKADEFIAKFREQIRLQRMASIRRATSVPQYSRNSST